MSLSEHATKLAEAAYDVSLARTQLSVARCTGLGVCLDVQDLPFTSPLYSAAFAASQAGTKAGDAVKEYAEALTALQAAIDEAIRQDTNQ